MKILLVILLLTYCSIAQAQDLIILKTGEEVKAKVIEVLEKEVKYKKEDFIEGPIYAYPKTQIFIIKYSNGTKDIFTLDANTNVPQHSPQYDSIMNLRANRLIPGTILTITGGGLFIGSIAVYSNPKLIYRHPSSKVIISGILFGTGITFLVGGSVLLNQSIKLKRKAQKDVVATMSYPQFELFSKGGGLSTRIYF